MGDGSHMNTMDVRIKITQDIIKESDQFSDDSHGGERGRLENIPTDHTHFQVSLVKTLRERTKSSNQISGRLFGSDRNVVAHGFHFTGGKLRISKRNVWPEYPVLLSDKNRNVLF